VEKFRQKYTKKKAAAKPAKQASRSVSRCALRERQLRLLFSFGRRAVERAKVNAMITLPRVPVLFATLVLAYLLPGLVGHDP